MSSTINKKTIITTNKVGFDKENNPRYIIRTISGILEGDDVEKQKKYQTVYFLADYIDTEIFETSENGEQISSIKKVLQKLDYFANPNKPELYTYDEINFIFDNIIKPITPTNLSFTDTQIWQERKYLLLSTKNKPEYGIDTDEWRELTENHLIID